MESALDLPLRWRKPRRIFVNSMGDLFHERVPDEWIDRVFAVMAWAPRHTFLVLTKRPERMREYLTYNNPAAHAPWPGGEDREDKINSAMCDVCQGGRLCGAPGDDCGLDGVSLPLPNVWLGVSIENRKELHRLDDLNRTPAAHRFVSFEPLLEDLGYLSPYLWRRLPLSEVRGSALNDAPGADHGVRLLDWLVIGGESGPGARPCDVAWIRSVVEQGRAAGTAVYVKQLGAVPMMDGVAWATMSPTPLLSARSRDRVPANFEPLFLRDRKGASPEEWPSDLRVREMPA